MRQLAAALFGVCLVAAGCRDHGRAVPAGSDAGAVLVEKAGAAAVSSPPSVPARPARKRWRTDRLSQQKVGLVRPDPRVVACEKSATDRDSLLGCLDGIAREMDAAPDAGLRRVGGVRPPITNGALLVSDWFVNPSGNDSNTCLDASHQCKTYAEINARRGQCPLVPTTVPNYNVHVTADLPATDPIVICDSFAETQNGQNIVGSTTTVSSGSLTGVVPKNRSAGQALNVNLGAAAAGSVGLMIQNTTHPSIAWVDSIVSGNVVLVSQPLQPATVVPPLTSIPATPVDTWTNGDAFQVLRPTKASVISADIKFQDVFSGYAFFHLWLQDASGAGLDAMTGNDSLMIESRFDSGLAVNAGPVSNCFFATTQGIVAGTGPSIRLGVVFDGGSFGTSTLTTESVDVDLGNDVIIRNLFVAGHELAYQYVYSPGGAINTRGSVSIVTSDIAGGSFSGASVWYGSPTINIADGALFQYDVSAAAGLPGSPILQIDGVSKATAWNPGITPADFYPGLTLNTAQLDIPVAPVSNFGFGGVALPKSLQGGFRNSATQATWTAPVQELNGAGAVVINQNSPPGTGQRTVSLNPPSCPAGQFLGGNPYGCAVPSGTFSCPVNLASCSTGTLSGTNGGTGLSQSGCPSGQFLGGTPYACSTPAGGSSFTCSNLSSCTGGQLPATGLAHGTAAGQFLVTNAAGNASEWDTLAPANTFGTGDVVVNNQSGGNVSLTVAYLQGFLMVLGSPNIGDVITFTSGSPNRWASKPPALPATAKCFTAGSLVQAATNTCQNVASCVVTLPSGMTAVDAWADFNMRNPDVAAPGADDQVGLATGPTTCFSSSDIVTVPPNGGASSGRASANVMYHFSGLSGSFTVFANAISATQTFTTRVTIMAVASN